MGDTKKGQGGDKPANRKVLTLFLCGDVMPGRGIDQVMHHPSGPRLHEPYVRDARDYVVLAEQVNGLIPKPVDPSYIWGDALAVLRFVKPDLRIINLETSITKSDDYWPGKGINYRMHPDNSDCLSAADIDCCVLANNHVLDWGYAGLLETFDALKRQGIAYVGAGRNRSEAEASAAFDFPGKGRLLVLAIGSPTAGVMNSWQAAADRPGVNLLPDLSDHAVVLIKKTVTAIKRPGDVVLFSIHWGDNWGYDVSGRERRFAHRLIDEAGVDALYGHSSHHVKGIEVYRNKLILYGCGDFLNDYEGIGGYAEFRADLTLMYFPSFDPTTGKLVSLRLMPMQIKRFQTVRVAPEDNNWLMRRLDREGREFGTGVLAEEDGFLRLVWSR